MARHAAPVSPVAQETMLLPVVIPDRPSQALGSAAIAAGHTADAYWGHAEHLDSLGEDQLAMDARSVAQEHEWRTGEMLDEVRTRLQTERERPDMLADYINYFIGDAFDKDRAAGHTQHSNIIDWLGDGEHGATDGQLFTFLNRHVRHLEEQQTHPEVVEVIERSRAQYVRVIEQGVAAGWLSPEALHSIGKVKDAHVVVGDLWDTFMQGEKAYFMDGESYVVVGQGARTTWGRDDTLENIRSTLPHEFSHLQFDDQRDTPIWFSEAMAEHINRIVQHGDPGVIDPDRRTDQGYYIGYRRFLANILSGRKPGSRQAQELLVAALHAYTSPADGPEWQEFMRQFDAEWGKGAFKSIADTIQARVERGGTHSDDPERMEQTVNAENLRVHHVRRRVGSHRGSYQPKHAPSRHRRPTMPMNR
jgi:hypothetical protein